MLQFSRPPCSANSLCHETASCSYATSPPKARGATRSAHGLGRHAHHLSLCTYPLQQRCRYVVPCASSTQEDVSTSGRTADDEYMKEYAQLKNDLIGGTRKSGGVLAAYLLLTVDAEAAVAALAGAAASNAYIAWLCKDVDNVKPTDRVPMWEAEAVENEYERKFKKLLAAYWHALKPRLLVPVALAALGWAGHQAVSVSPEGMEEPLLDSFHQACLLLGFLCYKVPLFLRVGDANVPKGYNAEESGRPMIYRCA
ncbi:hypothetical protein DUNSADRAFT_4924 [Dunaliella salina]|uniref:Uncharacterized protein n=1 Tax=Dunaliella salina TaxID=3046 RepID=A0ABQ7GR29_DUNSA|nr:hypothetical protein DUNSADRAFT_4924 [Dunaliella salina]|eukprot:KAF5837044.1 hypothetical protein DUNSADRAFT_4924 [Dunaliella salina]